MGSSSGGGGLLPNSVGGLIEGPMFGQIDQMTGQHMSAGLDNLPGVAGLNNMIGTAQNSPQWSGNTTNITNPTSMQQIGDAYTGSQNSLQSQQALLAALQAQNGIQNQSNVYNQMQGVANGTGPNPAQAMLNQATGANIANQSAMMAGQRGAGSNVGLMARQAANQGANIQQQATGQGAVMQANQSLNALGQMGNMAGQQVANQMGATQNNAQGQQNEQQMLLNAQQGVNNNNVGMQSNINSANAGIQTAKMGQNGAMLGGVMNGIGGLLGGAEGGQVQKYAEGTMAVAPVAAPIQDPTGPKSSFTKFLKGWSGEKGSNASASPFAPSATAGGGGDAALYSGSSGLTKGLGNMFKSSPTQTGTMTAGEAYAPEGTMVAAQGGQVPAMVSPGEKYLDRNAVQQVKSGKNPMQVGENIPGKAKVSGSKNDYANDTVPKTLESGGIVLPRSVTQAKDPAKKAAEFVAAILKRDALKGKK